MTCARGGARFKSSGASIATDGVGWRCVELLLPGRGGLVVDNLHMLTHFINGANNPSYHSLPSGAMAR